MVYRLRHEADDALFKDNTDVHIRHEAERSPSFIRGARQYQRSGFGDCECATADNRVECVKS